MELVAIARSALLSPKPPRWPRRSELDLLSELADVATVGRRATKLPHLSPALASGRPALGIDTWTRAELNERRISGELLSQ